MIITHLLSNNFKATQWSGGSTIELYIFPETADYKQGDYNFRLSTATVAVDSSEFTPLLGVSRTLMLLDGSMKLDHEGHHTSQLVKFNIDRFSGDWVTTSEGKCTDFNLMTKGETTGDQKGIAVSAEQTIDFHLQSSWQWLFIYVYSGDINVVLNHKSKNLKQGDLLMIQDPTESSIQIEAITNSELVFCHINH